MMYVWKCSKCGKGSLIETARPLGIVTRAHKYEEAHAIVSQECVKEHGSRYVSAEVVDK